MNNFSQKKVKRRTIPLETKILILKRLEDGEGSTAVANEFELGESTIRAIHKRASKIYESVNNATNDSGKRASYSRNIVLEKMERALVLWIKDLNKKRIPIRKELIQEKARQYFNQLKDLEPSSSSRLQKVKFSASNGWFAGFLQRYELNNAKIQGEAASAHEIAAMNYRKLLAKIIDDGGCCRDQIFNADDIARKIAGEGIDSFGDNDSKVMNKDQTVDDSVTDDENQREPESITASQIYAGIQISKKLAAHFLKFDKNVERRLKFQKQLSSCMSHYRDAYKQLTKRPSSQKLKTEYMVPPKKKTEILSSSDESDFQPINHKKTRVLKDDE